MGEMEKKIALITHVPEYQPLQGVLLWPVPAVAQVKVMALTRLGFLVPLSLHTILSCQAYALGRNQEKSSRVSKHYLNVEFTCNSCPTH